MNSIYACISLWISMYKRNESKFVQEVYSIYSIYVFFYFTCTFQIYDNGTYQGTDDYKIAEFEFDLVRKEAWKGRKEGKILTGKFTHIWKKENGQWRIYHEQYQRINRTAQ